MRGWLAVMTGLAAGAAALALISPEAGAGAASSEARPRPAARAPRALWPLQGGHATTGDPRSSVVMPEQKLDLPFNHAIHVDEVGLACTDCHESVTKSRNTRDLNLPAKAKCMECHDAGEIPGDWGPGVKNPVIEMPAAHVHFSHQLHLGAGLECSSCHAGVEKVKLATRDNLPSMEECAGCHVERGVATDCVTCHVKGRGGAIRTVFSSGTLIPDDHGTEWMKQHGGVAERDMGLCASCHAQTDCLSCHDGAIPPAFHASNYLALHPQDAMANSPQCASCHRLERFCRDCHFKAQVTLGNPLIPFVTGTFHPDGWTTPGSGEFHGDLARKNLSTCAGCHDASQDCRTCHIFFQGSPRIHPAGWANSRRMRQLVEANPALCLECHGQGEPGDPFPGP